MTAREHATQDYEYMKEAAKVSEDIWTFLVGQSRIKDPKVLRYSLNFLKDVVTVLGCANELGWRLDGFNINGDLEFYFDVYVDGQDIGLVSKGWADPGVRVGDLLKVNSEDRVLLREEPRLMQIFHTCSRECVSINFREETEGVLMIELWTPLYIDALTPKGISDAMNGIDACRREIARIIPFERY